MIGGFERHGDW